MKPIVSAPASPEITALENENRSLARKAAAEGMVLLENNGVLPLREKEIALYGAGARMTVKGGRGSTKSSFVSLCIILLILSDRDANAVIVRRYAGTLRDSVYAQMLWAISMLGLEAWFKTTTSPMEITYKPTGQRIAFRGMDDPLKMKGVKFTKGYCAIQWFEEIDQIETWDKVSSALRSFRRGGDRFWTFYSYNPPRTENQRELSEQLKKAEADYDNALLGIIAKAAQERDWKAAAWLMERRYPELYARPDVRLKMMQEGQVPEAEQVPTFTYDRSRA